MDVSHVPGGIKRRSTLIYRCFQPTRNRRFGAVVLLDCVTLNAVVAKRWAVLRNAYASKPLPDVLPVALRGSVTLRLYGMRSRMPET